MIDSDDSLESVSDDLTEVRATIVATRKALEAALGGQDDAQFRQAIARLDRIATEVGSVGEVVRPTEPAAR
jgi:hypothetical protein